LAKKTVVFANKLTALKTRHNQLSVFLFSLKNKLNSWHHRGRTGQQNTYSEQLTTKYGCQ